MARSSNLVGMLITIQVGGAGCTSAHMTKVPVCPVVSMPAKNSAAISGNIWRSLSALPERGSRARRSRSANEPRAGGAARMCISSALMMACRTPRLCH